jgi:hypothetical protein
MKAQNWKRKMPDVDKEEDRAHVVPSAPEGKLLNEMYIEEDSVGLRLSNQMLAMKLQRTERI